MSSGNCIQYTDIKVNNIMKYKKVKFELALLIK